MNKSGFTLVELLAVIALLAILMGIAVPNIISTINNNKRDAFLMDAKRMIAKADYLISSNKSERDLVYNGASIVYDFSDLNEKGEFESDTDNGVYDSKTYVKVSLVNNSYRYCICVLGSKRIISDTATCNPISASDSECLIGSELTGIDKVKDR